LRALSQLCEVSAIEFSAVDETYAWDLVKDEPPFLKVTLFNNRDVVHESGNEVARKVEAALDEAGPQVIAIPGWSGRATLAALRWSAQRCVPAAVMSESTAADDRRRWWIESVKRRVVGLFRSGLVGGRPQAEYLAGLGLPRERIFVGYDTVDNEHFWRGALAARQRDADTRRRFGLPDRYFLASNRFIPKKNLPFLLRAYARYRRMDSAEPWGLVLLGDGPLRAELLRTRQELDLTNTVLMPGFIQYTELPTYYGLASAFVHASTTEQWGLVVNEAMAAGLPVAVSVRCGCARDLVQDGQNGFLLDPLDEEGLARQLLKLAHAGTLLAEMSRRSREIIAAWSPARFAEGMLAAAQAALAAPQPTPGLLRRMLLGFLTRV
jgi:glycosyltransferase involved in cell wall biosynthesis